MSMTFSADENFAKQLDAEDPLQSFREKFHLPLGKDGRPLIYFAGNSLGLMPKAAREVVDQELDDWERLGVDAHLGAKTPWYTYHEPLREPTAQRRIHRSHRGRFRSYREESRFARDRVDCGREFFHRPVIRHPDDHESGAEARDHRRFRSRSCSWQRSAGDARLERRFRRLVYV